jgi:hypothetical protein
MAGGASLINRTSNAVMNAKPPDAKKPEAKFASGLMN